MEKVRREISCLARLDELCASNTSILDFLLEEKLITVADRKGILASSDVPKTLQALLAKEKDHSFQLLEYEWQLLPVERLKILIVTDRITKEFSYNF